MLKVVAEVRDYQGVLIYDDVQKLRIIKHVTPFKGDVNGDSIIDTLDLTAIASAFGTSKGDEGYNPSADLNQDGVVDIFDLVEVGRNFKKRF